jgi:hypothetical protein
MQIWKFLLTTDSMQFESVLGGLSDLFNLWFWFFTFFAIKEPLSMVFLKKIRFKELPVLVF